MVIVQINFSCTWGSTGKICDSISKLLSTRKVENYLLYIYGDNPQKKINYIKYGNFVYTKFQALKSKLFGNYGFNSDFATKKTIKKLDEIKPDVVHLHNIHGHDLNLEMLFKYFRERKTKLVWTFHDCWAFTGYCPHFTMAKCERWLTKCHDCPLRKEYSWFYDRSSRNFERKKSAMTGLDMTVVTPSQWLADLVKQSFLSESCVKVINNGIDLGVFKPSESNFRERYGLENKRILLGVAMGWGSRKGIDVFVELHRRLSDEYKIVLVGTNDAVDKELPDGIISIHRTQNQKELAEIYTAADAFINPTREDTYPTVNLEALACGTPVLTFKTGGSPEMLDETCGSVVECDDIDSIESEIIRITTEKPFMPDACIEKAKKFDQNERFKEYVELYERVVFGGAQKD